LEDSLAYFSFPELDKKEGEFNESYGTAESRDKKTDQNDRDFSQSGILYQIIEYVSDRIHRRLVL
jgi:hypothetical protein